MTEQKKTRVVVLPCGILASGDKTYCGNCAFWREDDEKSRDHGEGYGECGKKGGYRYASEYCFEGSDS